MSNKLRLLEAGLGWLLGKLRNMSLASPNSSDFASLERPKTRTELVLLSLVVFGIEICYAAETAFVTPILQRIGVPVQFMSMVWGVSPMVGFFACPILGSLSDVCTSRLGRRRPFIILYSAGILTGLLLTGYGHVLGDRIGGGGGDGGGGGGLAVILITIAGVILLDFDCDACQSPARAFLIDISQDSQDHSVGLSTFTLMAGAGGAIGYVLGGVPWADWWYNGDERTPEANDYPSSNMSTTEYYQADAAFDHKQILFTFVAVIYVMCAFISITSFKEIPIDGSCESASNYEQFDDSNYMVSFEDLNATAGNSQINKPVSSCRRQINKLNHLETLRYYLSSIIKMPYSLRWLSLTHSLCWMSLLCYSLYFTDYVGEEVYGGAAGNQNSTMHRRYDEGVRVGSLLMALYSISCSFYSYFLQKLTTRFSTKYVYMFSQLIYSLGMLVLALSRSLAVATFTSLTAGIMYSSLFTIPFILVANYHSQDISLELLDNDILAMSREPDQEKITSLSSGDSSNKSNIGNKRGLGTDLSFMSSMVFVAQFFLSFIIGPLMKYIGSKVVVLYVASFLSFIAAITSTRLLYLD